MDITEISVAVVAAYLLARGTLGEAGKDSYQTLKAWMQRLIGKGDLDKLEQEPDSDARRAVIAEALERAGAGDDPELARLTEALRAELAGAKSPDALAAIFERVKVQGDLIVDGISASGAGTQAAVLKDVEAGGNIQLGNIHADTDKAGKG